MHDDDSDDDDDNDNDKSSSSAKPTTMRLLDYACGTGAMSRILAPYTTQCIGIDLSAQMVAAYNQRARNQGLGEEEMVAYQGNFLTDNKEEEEQGFDAACVGLGFHHFEDPGLAARRIVQRLKAGGVFFVVDFMPHGKVVEKEEEGEHTAAAVKTVTHHGFSRESIERIFREAGAGDGFAVESLGEVKMGERMGRRELFLARGSKMKM